MLRRPRPLRPLMMTTHGARRFAHVRLTTARANSERRAVPARQAHASQPRSLSQRARARAMRAKVRPARERAKAHSHIRKTVQPDAHNARFTARSRCAFRASFGAQYVRRDAGTRPWRGQQCQKQPSTNTATFCVRKTKSGLPSSRTPRRQPIMRCSRINAISRTSVARFPRERTRAMISLRSAAVNTSGISRRTRAHCAFDAGSLICSVGSVSHDATISL